MDDILVAVNAAFVAKKPWFTAAGLKPPRIIDFFVGQTEHPEEFEIVLPALFMDYSIDWKRTGQYYDGPVNLMFHAVPDTAAPTENISPRQADGLKTIIWYRLVRQVLDTVVGENFSRLVRGQETPAVTPDLRYHIQTFTTQISEQVGTNVGKQVNATIEEINIDGNAKSKYSLWKKPLKRGLNILITRIIQEELLYIIVYISKFSALQFPYHAR